MRTAHLSGVFLTLLLTLVVAFAERQHSRSAEQTHFSAEESSVKHPVVLPQDVLNILREDVRSELEDENIPGEGLPASWYSASAIHLTDSGKVDFVIVGSPPLAGANVATFWVFRATARGHELILKSPAHDLIVFNTRRKGYRDIELVSMTARQMSTVLLRFDGERYVEFRSKSEPIR